MPPKCFSTYFNWNMCIYKDKQCLVVSESFQFYIRNIPHMSFKSGKLGFEDSGREKALSCMTMSLV